MIILDFFKNILSEVFYYKGLKSYWKIIENSYHIAIPDPAQSEKEHPQL